MVKLDIGSAEDYGTALTPQQKRPNLAPSVYLSDDHVAALGLSNARVGQKLRIVSNATVVSVRAAEDEDKDGRETTLSVRFDEMEVQGGEKSDPARALYGG